MPIDDTADVDQALVDQLDFGTDPPRVLVVREKHWPRAVGVVICFLIAPTFAYPFWLGVKEGSVAVVVFWAAIAAGLVLAAFWLVWQLMHPTMFYVAMDDRTLYVRRGPNSLTSIARDDIERFESGSGLMKARQRSRRRPRTILKGAHIRENLKLVTGAFNDRLNGPEEVPESPERYFSTDALRFEIIEKRKQYAAAVRNAGGALTVAILSSGIALVAPAGKIRGIVIAIAVSAVCRAIWGFTTALASRVDLRMSERKLMVESADAGFESG